MAKGFRDKFTHEQRTAEAERILAKYPDRVPVIVERYERCKSVERIDKSKYLTPSDMTVGQFMVVVRRRLNLSSNQALFLYFGDTTLAKLTITMREAHAQYASPDGFLYVQYAGENTFG